ncbi:MAG TPA: pyridoxal-phosphate dependent enzyme [Polyangiaceae bacterium]|jgi:D-cysteine desulfhydrase|nr:pyridoxal-phosphate dependent enzyme [Polyangiaceae bacterium]
MVERPLFQLFSGLSARVPLASLGEFPTPVEALPAVEAEAGTPRGRLYAKRDDLSSPYFGGNKVRTLEVFFGEALRLGKTHVFSTGAFGSNHAVATAVHAPRAGLLAGAMLYPQPPSVEALENLHAIVGLAARFIVLPHWSALPLAMRVVPGREERRGHRPFFMIPGGATPEGALGYVNAALELATDVARGVLPRPVRVVVPGGSGTTTAGLLAGFALAARLGIGFTETRTGQVPELVSVRVTPWPVTSRLRLAHLAARTSSLVATLAGEPSLKSSAAELARRLVVDGRFLGRGYGYGTPEGAEAMALFRRAGAPSLEATYSAKAAAALLRSLRERDDGPVVYWATRSAASAPLRGDDVALPAGVVRWVSRTTRLVGPAQP